MDVTEAIQALHPVRDEFLIRFYRWSAEFSRREFEGNFPTIGRIKNPSLQKLIYFARSLIRTDRLLLCSALVKRGHQRAVELLEDFPSGKEELLFEKSRQARLTFIREIDDARYKAVIRRPRKVPLRKILLKRLAPVLGEPQMIGDDRTEWTYSSQVRCWTVGTWIDTGGMRSFGYHHAIDAQPAVYLHSSVSILGWMGIGQTDWFGLDEDEYEEATKCLAQVCAICLNELPKLLDGLSHGLPEVEVRYWRTPFVVKQHRKNGLTTLGWLEPELQKAFGGKSAWEIPTSIIPQQLRKIGSHLIAVQDPSFTRENSEDSLALNPTYKHVRVEPEK